LIRVGVAASICFYRDVLALALDADPRLTVVATARTGAEAIAKFVPGAADVVVLDLGPQGRETVRALRRRSRDTQVVVLGIADSHEEVVSWGEIGAAGYASRSTSLAELVLVVVAAARGELRCPPDVAGALMRRVGALASGRSSGGVLTSREAEIAELIEAGLSNKEIATRLHIELATVKNHVHRVLEKLNVARRAEVAALVRSGLET
jgi:two-component system nitrate/nitrite response regulator NarL